MNVVTIQIQLHVGAGEEGPQSIALPRASNPVKTALCTELHVIVLNYTTRIKLVELCSRHWRRLVIDFGGTCLSIHA